MNHIATPDRINDATARDIRDRNRLGYILNGVDKLLDDLIAQPHDFEHPDCRYQPTDAIDALLDVAKSLRWELNRVTRGHVVLGDY